MHYLLPQPTSGQIYLSAALSIVAFHQYFFAETFRQGIFIGSLGGALGTIIKRYTANLERRKAIAQIYLI